MKFLEASPAFHAIYYFKYKWKRGSYPGISCPKTQYVYRLMYVADGECELCVDGRSLRLGAGDALYLLPGAVYRILSVERDFSMYNLFFSFSPAKKKEGAAQRARFVFAEDYQSALGTERVCFSDAPVFNESGVVCRLNCREALSKLASLSREDALFDFHANASLRYLLSLLLRAGDANTVRHTGGEKILSYIRENPDGDLSPDALSKRFLYHKNYINRLVKTGTGKTLAGFVRSVRIDHAKALLSEGGTSLTDLALMLGYYDYSHFYKAFVAETGVSPSAYQRKSD